MQKATGRRPGGGLVDPDIQTPVFDRLDRPIGKIVDMKEEGGDVDSYTIELESQVKRRIFGNIHGDFLLKMKPEELTVGDSVKISKTISELRRQWDSSLDRLDPQRL